MGDVLRLHPTHVLVASRDPRFLRVSWFLLRRDGFEVAQTARPSRLVEEVSRGSADIVVLDCGDAAAEAAELVTAVESACPGVGVVVVGERAAGDEAAGLVVQSKWSDFRSLVAAIDGAVARMRARQVAVGVGA